MTSENSLNIRVRLDFGDVLRASRLYHISIVPSWPFSHLILGAIPLSLGVLCWRYLLTASFDPHDNIILSFAIAAFLCLWGVALLLDGFNRRSLFVVFFQEKLQTLLGTLSGNF
jgi:hypothetical protein